MSSIHDRALAVYVRSANSNLMRCVGPHSEWVERTWSTIQPALPTRGSSRSQHCRVTLPGRVDSEHQEVDIYESHRPNEQNIAGLILKSTPPKWRIGSASMDEFFAELILQRIDVNNVTPGQAQTPTDSIVEQIVTLFDKELRYRVENDQWETHGRAYFAAKVGFFVNHNLTLQLCLPAFPCKSSNPEKVMGVLPDRSEEIALRRLHAFSQQIEQIYPPGAKISIISDGHVFSDCIGVDDKTVDEYGEHLKNLNQAISQATGGKDRRVQFQSLVDLFNLQSLSAFTGESVAGGLQLPELPHYLPTKLDDVAELCRRILVAGCQPSRESIRNQIDFGDEALLALYRGFSRFMLEDLERHPLIQSRSRSQRKKLGTKVSFEMIVRNQAYSNLIELMFPDYLRLSIHAHNNSGPKFGIRLFNTDNVRAVRELDSLGLDDNNDVDEGMSTAANLLHIPTPWHNCVVQVAGDPTLYIVKYGVVKEASGTHRYSSNLIQGDLAKGEGAFVSLKRSGIAV